MMACVDDYLLDDAKYCAFKRRGQPIKMDVVLEVDLHAAALFIFTDEILNCLDDAVLVENQRSQSTYQSPCFIDALAY